MYKESYGLLVKNGSEVIGNLAYSPESTTAAPADISVLRRDFVDKLFEKKAVEEAKLPQEVAEADILTALGLQDKRLK